MNVVVVGRGSLGGVLTRVLRKRLGASDTVSTLRGRPDDRRGDTTSRDDRVRLAGADVVVLAVPDPAIAAVAARLAPHLQRGAVVLHTAGARSVDELAVLAARGVHIGVLHPMVSFAVGSRPIGFAGTTFVGAGASRAVQAARTLTRTVGARFVEADVHGPAYHAAAALVANGSVALAWAGTELLVRQGFARRDAEQALSGLLASVARNVAEVGVPAALTGPIARGDAATVLGHRRALGASTHASAAASASAASAAYEAVAPSILACARARGLDADAASAVRSALDAELASAPRATPQQPAKVARATRAAPSGPAPERARARPRRRAP